MCMNISCLLLMTDANKSKQDRKIHTINNENELFVLALVRMTRVNMHTFTIESDCSYK